MGWFGKMLREARGNAIWDGIKWVCTHPKVIIAAVTGLICGFVGWVKNQPLPVLLILIFGLGLLAYLALLLIEYYVGEPIPDVLPDDKQDDFDRQPQGVSVALDELKKLLLEGEEKVNRYSHGESPTTDEIEDYRTTTLAAAKWRVFESGHVTLADIERFEENWDEDEVIMKKADLVDRRRLPQFAMNPFEFMAFDRLYGRVERLRELIDVISGEETACFPRQFCASDRDTAFIP